MIGRTRPPPGYLKDLRIDLGRPMTRMTKTLSAAPNVQDLPQCIRREAPARPAGCDPHVSTPCVVRGFHLRPRVLHVLESVSRYEQSLRCHCGRDGIAATVRFHVERTQFDWGDLPPAIEAWSPDETSVTDGSPAEDSREVSCSACFRAAPAWRWETSLVGREVVRDRRDFRIVCLECEAEFDDPFAWDLAVPAGVP